MSRGNPGLENSQNTSRIPLRLTNGQLKFGGLPAGLGGFVQQSYPQGEKKMEAGC
jgi:hypothetical protein